MKPIPAEMDVEQKAFNERMKRWLTSQPYSKQVENMISSEGNQMYSEPEGWHDSTAGNDPEAP
jgi:hypothetical protein